MHLDKIKRFYYKYHNYRENGKVKRGYYGRASTMEVLLYKLYKIRKWFKKWKS